MSGIVEIMKNLTDYNGSNGRTEEDIINYENSLNLNFAKDYRQYIKEIGLACFEGHELTGITDSARLNVVAVTIAQKGINKGIPSSWYVIEETTIDGIVIWQSSEGEIYQTAPCCVSKKIADSLISYISK